MPRNIVILLDGTSNEIEKSKHTNILRLYECLLKRDDQIVYYDPGVGTIGDETAWLRVWRKAQEIWGMATGWGLDTNVKEAYRFLVETYEKGEGSADRDRIYILGFSRGAYSARVLAGFIHAFGIMERRNLNLLDYAYRAYKRIGEDGDDDAFAEIRLFEKFLDPDRPPIRFLGLFDTVASVIEWGRIAPRLKSHAFTKTNPSVESVRHAVAIDERRTMFRAKLWPEGGLYKRHRFMKDEDAAPQDAREVWFTGVHGDVGGGYPEAESGLAKLPLLWMILEAQRQGAGFWTQSVNRIARGDGEGYVPPDPLGKTHNSMTPGWKPLEILPRRQPEGSRRPSLGGWYLPLCDPRTIPDNARIHAAVIARAEARGRWPKALPSTYRVEETDGA